MKVSDSRWQPLYRAMCLIALDNNLPHLKSYVIPEVWHHELDYMANMIKDLTDEEFNILAAGEESEKDALVELHGIQLVDDFLNDFFEGWELSK